MSQTRARRLYRRWTQHARRCNKIGGIAGNRVPEATARAAIAIALNLNTRRRPYPTWPGKILCGRFE